MPAMPPRQSNKRKRKIGKMLPRTDDQLEALAGGVPTADEIAELLARTEAVSPLAAKLMQVDEADNGADGA
jgi:hypothetical protein